MIRKITRREMEIRGEALQRMRMRRGVSLESIAEETGINAQRIALIEAGLLSLPHAEQCIEETLGKMEIVKSEAQEVIPCAN